MPPTVRFGPEQRVLAFGDGSRAGRDRVSELPTLPISVLSQATVGELTRAMSMFAVGFGTVDDVEAKELRTWTLAFDPVRGRSPKPTSIFGSCSPLTMEIFAWSSRPTSTPRRTQRSRRRFPVLSLRWPIVGPPK